MSFVLFRLVRQRPKSQKLINKGEDMRKEYDFSKARKNPYASMLKKPITIRLDEESVNYFKSISEEVGIPLSKPH
jgi:uncharacterized protein (DUF4415 family)